MGLNPIIRVNLAESNRMNGPKVDITACSGGNIRGNTRLYAGNSLEPALLG